MSNYKMAKNKKIIKTKKKKIGLTKITNFTTKSLGSVLLNYKSSF